MHRFQTAPRPLATTLRADRKATVVDDAMLRGVGVALLLGIAALHFVQIVDTLQATLYLGIAYLAFITACVMVAAATVATSHPRTWIATGALSVAAIGAYSFTRVLGTALDNQDVGNWSCTLGLAALFLETTTVAVSAYALATKVANRRRVLATAAVNGDSPRLKTARPTAA